ncbi:MAG: DUF222 domain-containing protein [Woeseia sp.]
MSASRTEVAALVPSPRPIYTEGVKLGAEITELCSYIYAATYQLLVMIREFDEKRYWHWPGLCSCAHWLNFKCGIGMNAAREKVRVAHALAGLPKISEAFRKGELSYSKVRAMTRIADPANEDYLLMIARHGTAYHVEKLVSKYRRCKRLQETATANARHRAREVSCRYDTDGTVVVRARLPAEQGELVMKALELAMERRQTDERAALRAAEKAGSPAAAGLEPLAASHADALTEIAESYLNHGASPASTADRYQVVMHVSAETLKGNSDVSAETLNDDPDVSAETSEHVNSGISHVEGGPTIAAETARRIACDCSRVLLLEDDDGEPLSIGRKSRSIPPAIRRALSLRDDGCRFPGCTHRYFVDGHHIRHWADGGETRLDNLVQLCRRHHRMVHEGGVSCERLADGRIAFKDRCRQVLSDIAVLPAIDDGIEDRHASAWIAARLTDLEIDEHSCVPQWYAGEKMDWNLAVGNLFR